MDQLISSRFRVQAVTNDLNSIIRMIGMMEWHIRTSVSSTVLEHNVEYACEVYSSSRVLLRAWMASVSADRVTQWTE